MKYLYDTSGSKTMFILFYPKMKKTATLWPSGKQLLFMRKTWLATHTRKTACFISNKCWDQTELKHALWPRCSVYQVLACLLEIQAPQIFSFTSLMFIFIWFILLEGIAMFPFRYKTLNIVLQYFKFWNILQPTKTHNMKCGCRIGQVSSILPSTCLLNLSIYINQSRLMLPKVLSGHQLIPSWLCREVSYLK